MPIQPSTSSTDLIQRLEQVMTALGYTTSLGLVRSWPEYKAATSRHVVRQAFETIGVHAVFGFPAAHDAKFKRFSPVLYLALAADDAAAKSVHRLVWSQGVVPILLIATPAGLQIRRGLTPPTPNPLTVAWSKFETDSLPVELTSLTALALSSSIVWRDYTVDRSARVDTALLDAIVSLNNAVRNQHASLKQKASLVNSLIGRFIYIFVLLDRGIIGHAWIRNLKDKTGKPLCATIANSIGNKGGIDPSDVPWPAREIWALFDQIDRVLNGAIFPITSADRRLVPADALHLVLRTIRHGDTLHGGVRQLGFLDVSFATLRTETISAIYELFLLIESPDDKDEEGAFYTPPFLVDYVLDEVDRISPFSAKSRVLDPAAGSGIFLVGAYRRIIERSIPSRRWKAAQFQRARKLLVASIHGIERNTQAANVARFSLYLTLLDYVEYTSINALRRLVRGAQVFPQLAANILDRDVFSLVDMNRAGASRFSHVVGNPPWGTFGDNADRTNVPRSASANARRRASLDPALAFLASLDPAERPVTNKRLSELFVWKIQRDLVAKNGVMGLLISTRSFVAPSAHLFPNALSRQCKIVGLANLSHFRYRLFSGARSPTLAVFAENRNSDPLDQVWIYSPLLTSQPIGESGHPWSIIVSELDVEIYKLRDLSRVPEGWFWALMLRPIDRRFVTHLTLWASRFENTFGHFLKRSGLIMGRGGSPRQTGLPDELLLRSGDYRARLGLEGLGLDSYRHDELQRRSPAKAFARMFAGNIVFIPRHMNEVIFIERPVAFVSTFNAVYTLRPSELDASTKEAMRGIARFLTSEIARYLYALFGKTRLLDRARLEKNDLESIPFPFADLGDFDLRALESFDENQITQLFAQKTGLDDAFVREVEEYASFRHGYEDSQVPLAGLNPPDAEAVASYKDMLLRHLGQNFGPEARFEERVREPNDKEHFGLVDIHIAKASDEATPVHGNLPALSLASGVGFSPHSRIVFDPNISRVALTKPWTRVAWTIEQAYADARGITEEVLRSGATT